MIFIELRMQNLLSFAEEQVLRLTGSGLTLIEGVNEDDESARSNGGGKSAIADALYWVLYGLTTHSPTAEGDDVIWRYGNLKNCLGRIFFSKDDSTYEVRRGRACVKEAKELLGRTTGLALFKDGEHITLGTTKATQALLNSIIGMSASTFRHCVIFGQSRAYRFASLTDSQKKAVFDDMLGVELYTKAAKLARDKEKVVATEISSIEARLMSNEQALQDSNARYEDYLQAEDSFEKDKIQKLKSLYETLAKRESLVIGSDEVSNEKKQAGQALRDALTNTGVSEAKCVSLSSKDRTAAVAAAEVTTKVQSKQRQVTKAEHLDTEPCDRCGAAITAKSRRTFTAKLKQELGTITSEAALVLLNSSNATKALKRAKSKLRRAEELDACAYETYDVAKDEVVKYRRRIECVEAMRADIDDLEASRSPYKPLMHKECAKRLHLRLQCNGYAEDLEALAVDEAKLAFWREGFDAKGLRSLMIDSVLPYLNARVEEYSNTITDGNIQIEFRTVKENKDGTVRDDFHIHVDNLNGAGTYGMCSIGERAKIDLIVGLALQDMAVNKSQAQVNVAFFDEPFDGLDDVAMDRVVDLLSDVLKHRDSVYVITHNQSLKSFIPQSITVTKKNKKSTINDHTGGSRV